MNLLEANVTKVLSIPYFKYDKWWVRVEYSCWGLTSKTELMFNNIEDAEKINIGFKFLI